MNSPKIDRCRTAFKLPADGRHTHPKRFLPAVPLNHQVHTSEKLRTSLALTSSSHHALAGTETALVNRQCPAIKHPQQPARNRVSCLLCRPAGELTQIAALAAVTHAPAAPADTKKYLRFADKQGRKEFSDTTHVLKGDYVLNRRPTNEKLSLKSVTSSPHATLLKSSLSGSITDLYWQSPHSAGARIFYKRITCINHPTPTSSCPRTSKRGRTGIHRRQDPPQFHACVKGADTFGPLDAGSSPDSITQT